MFFRLIFVFLFLLSGQTIFGQDDQLALKKGRLFTKEGNEIIFNSLQAIDGQYSVKKSNGSTQTFGQDDIWQIDQQAGSKALLFAGVMGGSALLGSLLGVAQAEAGSGVEADPGSKAKIVLGLTAAGALVGALIGANKKKYKAVYKNPAYGIIPGQFKLDFKDQNGVTSFTLNYSF